jgi:hypothetical protein
MNKKYDFSQRQRKSKKAQEEMVGFALIIIIVSVIILVFLSFSLRKTNIEIESYEVESFIQSLSQHTSNCSITYAFNYLDVKDLIEECAGGRICLEGQSACEALNSTLIPLINNSWKIGENRPNKGYIFNSTYLGEEVFSLKAGNFTKNSKGSVQNFEDLDISFEVYF